MKIEIKKIDGNEMEFILKDANISFANALRRVAMFQVPVFAVDTITFYENSSKAFDEYLANRIGLIPLKTEDGYTSNEIIILSVDAEGPKTVYSGDLKSSDEKLYCVHGRIPIMKLMEGQRIKFEAKARLGIGREHAKFQTGLVSYTYDPKDPTTFSFTVESFGQLPPSKMILSAIELLQKKCNEFVAEIENVEKVNAGVTESGQKKEND